MEKIAFPTAELAELRRMGIDEQKIQIENNNKIYFLEECAKLDAYSEDLKEGLQQRLKELKKTIGEKKKSLKQMLPQIHLKKCWL